MGVSGGIAATLGAIGPSTDLAIQMGGAMGTGGLVGMWSFLVVDF